MDPLPLLSALANLGGGFTLAAAILLLHREALRAFREELATERELFRRGLDVLQSNQDRLDGSSTTCGGSWNPHRGVRMFEQHPAVFHAVADAPAGLIRSAISQAGVTIGQFLTWLAAPGNVGKLIQIGLEYASGNTTQAIQDLANLLNPPAAS